MAIFAGIQSPRWRQIFVSKQTRHGSESAYSASHYLDMDYTDSSSTADLQYLEKYHFFFLETLLFLLVRHKESIFFMI